MAKKPGTNPKGEFVFFDVVYEDGSQRSNRRVPAELVERLVVTVPEASQGDIMGDLNAKRGRIQGTSSIGHGEVETVSLRDPAAACPAHRSSSPHTSDHNSVLATADSTQSSIGCLVAA